MTIATPRTTPIKKRIYLVAIQYIFYLNKVGFKSNIAYGAVRKKCS